MFRAAVTSQHSARERTTQSDQSDHVKCYDVASSPPRKNVADILNKNVPLEYVIDPRLCLWR